ncbi:MAG: replication protein [Thermomicrobiales bacterium]
MLTPPQSFAGFTSPNYTQVPDELFDLLMPQLSECELRVLLYIIRRTFGFKRESDSISLSQMVSGITTRDGQVLDTGTGQSKATVARGLKGLRDKGIILAERNRSAKRGDEPTTYRLRFASASQTKIAGNGPVSQPRDRGPVSLVRQAVSQPRDTQETGEQETAFESSNGQNHVDKTEATSTSHWPQTTAEPHHTGSLEEGSLANILHQRKRPEPGRDDRAAIGATVERFAVELGDQANPKVTLKRALNLYQASGLGRDTFVDLLFQAKGGVQDRRKYPGKAPLTRNLMAYFFAMVEDRLGLKERVE